MKNLCIHWITWIYCTLIAFSTHNVTWNNTRIIDVIIIYHQQIWIGKKTVRKNVGGRIKNFCPVINNNYIWGFLELLTSFVLLFCYKEPAREKIFYFYFVFGKFSIKSILALTSFSFRIQQRYQLLAHRVRNHIYNNFNQTYEFQSTIHTNRSFQTAAMD